MKWNGEAMVSFLKTCGFGGGNFMLYRDTGACTVGLCLEQLGLNAENVVRRSQFSRLANLAGILQQCFNIWHAAFVFTIDWNIALVHVPSPMFWSRSNGCLNLDHEFSEICVQG